MRRSFRGHGVGGAIVTLLVCLLLGGPVDGARRGKSRTVPLPDWVITALESAEPEGRRNVDWLLVEQTVQPLPGEGVFRRSRYVARAVDGEGVDALRRVAASFNEGDSIRLTGWVVTENGRGVPLDPKDDIVDVPAADGVSLYDDNRALVATFSGLAPGSVVAWEEEHRTPFDFGADSFLFGSPNQPTVRSVFRVRPPDGWSVDWEVDRTDVQPQIREDGSVEMVLENLLPLPIVEGSPSPARVLPHVWVRWSDPGGKRGFEDWNAFGDWYRRLYEPAVAEAPQTASIGDRLKPASAEAFPGALEAAFDFAARDVRYVSIQVGMGGYRPVPPDEVVESRYGDCKAKTFLMREIVKRWGVDAFPVIVRTSDLGPVTESIATPTQFNHAIVAVKLPADVSVEAWNAVKVEGLGRLLLVDATAASLDPWTLPLGVQGTRVAIVHPGGATLVTAPEQPTGAARLQVRVDVELDGGGGIVDGRLEETWGGVRAGWVRNYWSGLSDDERDRRVTSDLQDRFPGAVVASHDADGLDGGRELTETTEFREGRAARRVGDLLIVDTGKLSGALFGRRIPGGEREWSYSTGGARENVAQVQVKVPQGWEPEALPDPFEIDDASFASRGSWNWSEGVLEYRRESIVRSGEIPADGFAAFREAVRTAEGAEAQAIVFVRP